MEIGAQDDDYLVDFQFSLREIHEYEPRMLLREGVNFQFSLREIR